MCWVIGFKTKSAPSDVSQNEQVLPYRELHIKPKFSMCFVPCLKIINTVWKTNIRIQKQNVSETQSGIKILIGQAVLELLIKTTFCMCWSITQELQMYWNFVVEFLRHLLEAAYIIFRNIVDNFETGYKTVNFGLKCSSFLEEMCRHALLSELIQGGPETIA